MLRDVVLGAPAPAVANAAPPSAPVQQHGAFRVAAGAFRFPENAAAVRQQIERLGGHAEITRSGSLDLVTVGPFATREAAEAEATRLRAANVDAVARNPRQLLARLQRSG